MPTASLPSTLPARLFGIGLCVAIAAAITTHAPPAAPVDTLRDSALRLVASFDEAQRDKALFRFDDAARFEWSYFPGERIGLSLGELSEAQRGELRALFGSVLSADGLRKVEGVLALEGVLFERESRPDRPALHRDPSRYWLAVFGRPETAGAPWAWRFEGHHLSIHCTVSAKGSISTTPLFLGANPARVADGAGEHAGLEPLADVAGGARALVASFDETQRVRALRGDAPDDVFFGPDHERVPTFRPTGLPGSMMTEDQRAAFGELLDAWVDDLEATRAEAFRSALGEGGVDGVLFSWMGEPDGERAYYRILGNSFLMEYAITAPNHVHTLWRDRDGDFGRDAAR